MYNKKEKFYKQFGDKLNKETVVDFNDKVTEAIVYEAGEKNYFEYKNNKWIWVASKEW